MNARNRRREGRWALKMIEHFVDLEGPSCFGRFARPETVGLVLSHIKPTVRESVRMSILHSSRRVGRPWRELTAVWDIRYGGQCKSPQDGTRLVFCAPTLVSAAPILFEQGQLFDDGPDREDTGFDLLGKVLADVGSMKRESERFDADLLGSVARFGVALKKGLSGIWMRGQRLGRMDPPPIDRKLTAAATALVQEVPKPQRARVMGRLNMIRISDRAFELLLADGQTIRAVWTQPSVVHLRDYLDREVVIEGQAVFRPSGCLLRIDAEAIAGASERDKFFSQAPTPTVSIRRQLERAAVPTRGQSGFAAIYGKWPGDETEEELLAALEEIS